MFKIMFYFYYYTRKHTFVDGLDPSRIFIQNVLSACQKNDLDVNPITILYLFANVFVVDNWSPFTNFYALPNPN
jgi:hypothetical protein